MCEVETPAYLAPNEVGRRVSIEEASTLHLKIASDLHMSEADVAMNLDILELKLCCEDIVEIAIRFEPRTIEGCNTGDL